MDTNTTDLELQKELANSLSHGLGLLFGIVSIPVLIAAATKSGSSAAVIGGSLYSVGVLFYLWGKFTYHHVVWHLFVLAASICHYVAVFLAVS